MQLHLSNGNILTINQEAAKQIVAMMEEDTGNLLIKIADDGTKDIEFLVRIDHIIALV